MKRTIKKAVLWLVVCPLLLILICYYVIEFSSNGRTYSSVDALPNNRVGLVLGTSNKLTNGHSNPYYANRINATVTLYKAKKIDYILVSGDNGSIYYNEPTTIKKDLIKKGIPADKIFLDYAGFRTLDSMVRAKVVFGLDSVTVISQKFHNERAIYLAKRKGLTAIGFNAKDIPGQQGFKVHFREYFARVKVFLDLLLKTEPKFYGNKIKIE